MLNARIVVVHRLNGDNAATVRFNLNEEASSDLERARIESPAMSLELLAEEVTEELRSQLTARR